MSYEIAAFEDRQHRTQVIALWRAVFGYETAHNDPGLVIDKKLAVSDGLFFVAKTGDTVVGTVMAGYDGHRGWLYSLAVAPEHRQQGLGSQLLAFAEEKLLELGCMKINLQVVMGNEAAEQFYVANGYQTEQRISMGKRLPANIGG